MNARDLLSRQTPVLFVPVRESEGYKADRRWGIFDTLRVRALDDLFFPEAAPNKTIVAFSEEPPPSSGFSIVPIPTQVALERIFFHIQEVSTLVMNPRGDQAEVSEAQRGFPLSSQGEEVVIARADLPELIGACSLPVKKITDPIERAFRALRKNSMFEAFALARGARLSGKGDTTRAWFAEAFAISFLGVPEAALSLYEGSPLRGSNAPDAQLVAARYRLLLKQFNEARTILHGLSFHEELGALAQCELARSYLMSGELDRAIDLASGAIKKDPTYLESYLVRGVAQRGMSYAAGDEDGLREAHRDLEKVAMEGVYSAPEALFHAGTIFGRLGGLEQAEIAFRQSLFQRDRYSSRDALVRVLCAAGKMEMAKGELAVLSLLAPTATSSLHAEVDAHLAEGEKDGSAAEGLGLESLSSASQSLREWGVPIRSTVEDLQILDEFINRFAPSGEFIDKGPYARLHDRGVAAVSRTIAQHLASVILQGGVATKSGEGSDRIEVISRTGVKLPLEAIVHDRVLLGASGDNLSSLEGIVMGACGVELASSIPEQSWWRELSQSEIQEISIEVSWAREKLVALGAALSGGLGDLEEIDRAIERAFEPGGKLSETGQFTLKDEVDRFVVGAGLLVGAVVAEALPSKWYGHEVPEGISLLAPELGRIFPVARMQRRAYLAAAADITVKLGSFALSVAASVLTDRIRQGVYSDRAHVVTAFKELLPQVSQFSEDELESVVSALWLRSNPL